MDTLFENYSKCRIWIFEFWHFPPIFVILKLTCLVTLFDRKLQFFKNSPKWTILGIFNQVLSTQNVYVARFARNVEWDFFCDFQTPCMGTKVCCNILPNVYRKRSNVVSTRLLLLTCLLCHIFLPSSFLLEPSIGFMGSNCKKLGLCCILYGIMWPLEIIQKRWKLSWSLNSQCGRT